MAFSVGTLSATVTADTSEFDSAMRQVERKGERTASSISDSFSQIGQNLMGIGAGLSAAITVPIGLAGAAALKSAAKFESLKVQLEVLTGSAQAGQEAFQKLTKYATETPFALNDVVSAGKRLITVLGDVGRANEVLQNLGDIAAIAIVPLASMSNILAQIQTKGQAMTEELRQFGERGIPIFEILSNSMQTTKQRVQELVTAGEVGFRDVAEAIAFATSKQGMFYQGAEQASKTLTGLWSNLTGAIQLAGSKIGMAVAKSFSLRDAGNQLIATINNLTSWFTNLNSSTQKVILSFAAITAALPPLIAAFGALSVAIGAISWPVVAGAAIVSGLVAIASNVAITQSRIESMQDALKNLNNISLDGITQEIKNLKTLITNRTQSFGYFSDFRKLLDTLGIANFETIKELKNNLDKLKVRKLELLAEQAQKLSGTAKDITLNAIDAGNIDVAVRYLQTFQDISSQAVQTNNAIEKMSNSMTEASNTATVMQTGIEPLAFTFENIKPPTEKILSANLPSIQQLTAGVDLSLPMKLFPPGSAGYMRDKLRMMRRQLKFITNPRKYNQLQSEIIQTSQKLNKLGKSARISARMSRRFTNILANGLSRALFSGKSLLDTLSNIGKQLASLAASSIFRSLLTGGPIGGLLGGIGSLIGGIFHSGGIVGGSGDVPVMAQAGEGIFTPGQMRALGLMINRPSGGGKMSVTVNVPDIYLDGQKIYENQQSVKEVLDR